MKYFYFLNRINVFFKYFFGLISNSKRETRSSLRLIESKCERSFITFENDNDEKVFTAIFKKPIKREKRSKICVITRLPAKYFDPITQLPYRNLQAFKILREAYYQQMEEKGCLENDLVSKWIQHRKIIKENRNRTLRNGI